MKNNKYIGIVLADIHVGVMNLAEQISQFEEIIIENIAKMEKLDFLVIAGDFFDHKFYLNDKESVVAYSMLKKLLEVCERKNAVVRIVYGTESHECNQYDILSLLKIYEKVKVVKYAEEEELLPGMNVLYLPEEYIDDKDEYYKNYFNKENYYDYIFGHGVIREVMHNAVVQMENKEKKSNTKRKKVPVFTSSELSRICKGQVFFGHYHVNTNIDDKVFYVGSFSRWQFGEEKEKGYYLLENDFSKEKYKATFIENTMAKKFITISYGYENNAFTSEDELHTALDRADELLDKHVFDHVRFMFNIPKEIENPESTINFLKEKYKFNNKVKLEFCHGYVEEKRKQQKEKVNKENEKYLFIFDNNISLEEKVSRYIAIEYDRYSTTTEKVSKYIYEPLSDILQDET